MRLAYQSVTHDRGVANVFVRLAVPYGNSAQPFDARCQAGGVGCLHELVSRGRLLAWDVTGRGRYGPGAGLFPGHEYSSDPMSCCPYTGPSPGRPCRYGGRIGGWANPSSSTGDHARWPYRCDWSDRTVPGAWVAIRRAQCGPGGRAYCAIDRDAGGRTMGDGRRGFPCDLCTAGRRTGPTIPRSCVLAAPVSRNYHVGTRVDAITGAMGGVVLSSHRHDSRSPFDGLVSSYVRRRHW